LTEKIRTPAYDTLIVVGGALSLSGTLLSALSAQLKTAFEHGTRRIVSASTGSFLLAEAGLLDRRIVTTHWKYTVQLQRKCPKARVDGNRIFANDNGVWTSAGGTAAIDLALALIEEDLGSKVADLIAQLLVVYRRRPGCQMQYAAIDDVRPQSAPIRATLAYMKDNSHLPISAEKLATVANLSLRQFGRTFLAETGETPAKTLERLRVEAARARLENSNDAIEIIATITGFGDADKMRKAFIRVTGHPPQSIRRLANCCSQNVAKTK
jgi:transcriptional regulator GlxA family with amidase domain